MEINWSEVQRVTEKGEKRGLPLGLARALREHPYDSAGSYAPRHRAA